MAFKCWRKIRKASYKSARIQQWDKLGADVKVIVSPFDHGRSPKDWQVQTFGLAEAKKGYPSSKTDITKKEALRRAKAFMRQNDRC